MIANQIMEENKITKLYLGIKKIRNMERYSSDLAEKISKQELRKIIEKSGLLESENELNESI